MRKQDLQIRRLTVLAMLAALSYVAFAVLQFRILLPGGTPPASTWAMRSACWARCCSAGCTAAWAARWG